MSALDDMFGAALVIPDAVDRARAADLRARATYARYGLVDRGSYDAGSLVLDAALTKNIVDLANRATNRSLAIEDARVIRLCAGDYILAHHDRLSEGNPVEVTLDVSPAPVPTAEVHYRRRGQVFLRFPCVPGTAAVVERGPTVTCNHTYVSKLHTTAEVIRVVALLR